jgi:hypothetical protein
MQESLSDVGNNVPKEEKSGISGKRCCNRFRTEFGMSFFQLEDHSGALDLEKSFAIEPRSLSVIAFKFLFLGLSIYTFIGSWINRDNPKFYLAYLSNWSVVYALLYLSTSLICSLGVKQMWLIKTSWVLYSLAATNEITVMLLFWLLTYDPSTYTLSFFVIMVHGGIMAIVLIEGNFVNRVPVRLKHTILPVLLGIVYVIWSIIHTTVVENNPDTDDEEDDALYSVLRWRNETVFASIIAVMVCFILIPAVTSLVWVMSLPNRCYQEVNECKDDNKIDVEMEEGESGAGHEMDSDQLVPATVQ